MGGEAEGEVDDLEGLFREVAAGHEGDGGAATEDVEGREEEQDHKRDKDWPPGSAATIVTVVWHGGNCSKAKDDNLPGKPR